MPKITYLIRQPIIAGHGFSHINYWPSINFISVLGETRTPDRDVCDELVSDANISLHIGKGNNSIPQARRFVNLRINCFRVYIIF